MKWLRVTLLILAVVIGLIVAALSPWGTRLIVHSVDSMLEPLEVGSSSGSLLSNLTIKDLEYADSSALVRIETIDLDIQWTCLFGLEFCINDLRVTNSQIALTPAPSDQVESKQTSTVITLPIPVSVKRLVVQDFDLSMEDTFSLGLQRISAKLDMYQRLTVEQFELIQPILTLPTSAPEANNEGVDFANIAEFRYQPPNLDKLEIPINAQIQQFRVEDFKVQQNQQTTLALSSLVAQLSVQDSELKISEFKVNAPNGQLSLQGSLQSDYQHNFSLDGKVVFTQSPSPLSFQAKAQGSPSKLNLSLATQGLIGSNSELTANLMNSQLPINLDSTWQDFSVPIEGQSLHISAGTIGLEGELEGYQLTAETAVKADTLPKVAIRISALANPTNISIERFQADSLGGDLSIEGKVAIAEQIRFQGQALLNSIQPGLHWPALEGDINGDLSLNAQFDGQRWQAKLTQLGLSGQWLGYQLNASGEAFYDSVEGLDIPQIQVSNGDNKLTLVATLDADNDVAANIDIVANKLEQLYPGLSGSLRINSELAGQLKQPELTIQAGLRRISYQQTNLNSADLSGSLTWNEEKPIDLDLQLNQLSFSGEPIDLVDINVEGNAEEHQLTLQLKSQSINFDSSLTGTLTDTQWQGIWHKGEFNSQWGDYLLDTAETQLLANWQAQRYFITPHCWKDSQASLCINQAKFADQLAQFDVNGEQLELLQIISTYLPQLEKVKTESKLQFSAVGTWQMGGDALPEAELFAKLTPAKVYVASLVEPITLNAMEIRAKASAANLTSSVQLNTTELGQVSADIRLDDWAEARNLSGDVLINDLHLSPLAPTVSVLNELSGQVSGELNLQGTLATPLLYGKIAVQDVSLSGDVLPTRISDWDQEVKFDGQRAELDGHFYLGKGKGSSSGYIDWSDSPVGQMQLNGEMFEFDYRDTLKATISPDITIKIEPERIDLNGKVDVLKARVKVKELPEDAYSPSDDAVIVNQPAAQDDPTTPVFINFIVNIDPNRTDDVKLDAFGLTTDLHGSLELNQTDHKLIGHGDLNLVNGRYQAYGQDLQIRKGEILFNGPLDQPLLDIEAIREPSKTADDVIVGIRVSGQAETPKIAVFSNPAMEESEMLSYLLQGRSMNSPGEELDNSMLAVALLNAGLAGSENRVTRFGEKLGIEDLSLDTSGSGDDTQISVSGYIAPGVQLRYGVGVFDSASQVALRYQLMPSLYLEAVNGVNNALDIYYQFSLGKAQSNTDGNTAED